MLHNQYPSQYEGDNHPVENVSWDDAQSFVRLMSFFGRHEYRLPSEAEWEHAARGGTVTARYWGERAQGGCDYENMTDMSLKNAFVDTKGPLPESIFVDCDREEASAMPVGSFKPNPFGLYDMLGNVAEWVADCYLLDYAKAPTDGTAATAANCTAHVIRGGSWIKFPRNLRAANRVSGASDFRSYLIGFRVERLVRP
jgi:formylglycine-generating enzyme required for sulfatase activity